MGVQLRASVLAVASTDTEGSRIGGAGMRTCVFRGAVWNDAVPVGTVL